MYAGLFKLPQLEVGVEGVLYVHECKNGEEQALGLGRHLIYLSQFGRLSACPNLTTQLPQTFRTLCNLSLSKSRM